MGELETDFILVLATVNDEKFGQNFDLYLLNLKNMGFVLETITSQSLQNRKFVKVQMPLDTAIYAAGIYRIGLACKNQFHEPESETPPCFRFLDSELTTREPSSLVLMRNRESVRNETPQKPTTAERIMIVYEALKVAKFGDQPNEFGIEEMKRRGILEAAYPIHDGQWQWTVTGPLNDRQLLSAYWSSLKSIFRIQPIELIHKYFGPEAGFYFAMLGLYMALLAPAAILGLISCLAYNHKKDTRVNQICNSNYCMCPHCISPKKCNFSMLKFSCKYSRLNYIFDNDFTMPFSIIMSFWGVIFLSIWERKRSFMKVSWNIHRFLRPDFATRPGYCLKSRKTAKSTKQQNPRPKKPQLKQDNFWASFKSRIVNFFGNIRNRFSSKPRHGTVAEDTESATENLKPSVSCGSIFSKTEKSNPFVEERNEKNIRYLTRKERLLPLIHLLIGVIGVCFVKFFTLICIILFRISITQKISASEIRPPLEEKVNINFRGDAIVYAAKATAALGTTIIIIFDFAIDFLAEMLTNLENPRTQREFDRSYTVKLVTLSFINNFTIPIYLALFRGINYTYPGDKKMWKFFFGVNADFCDVSGCFADVWIFLAMVIPVKSLFNFCKDVLYPILYKKVMGTVRLFTITEHPQWELDHDLTPLPRYYFTKLKKELIIQYGYVLCFASSFPLLPLIVLVVNIIELRLHALMLIRFFQRFVPRQSCEMDIWKKLFYIMTMLAVFINALILGNTLNWPERQFYKKFINDKLYGYVETSVSKFTLEDYGKEMEGTTLKECYYVGRREPKGSEENEFRKYQLSDLFFGTYCATYIFIVVLWTSNLIFGLLLRYLTSPPLSLQEKIIYQEKTHPE